MVVAPVAAVTYPSAVRISRGKTDSERKRVPIGQTETAYTR
jgi:hypothetical protein